MAAVNMNACDTCPTVGLYRLAAAPPPGCSCHPDDRPPVPCPRKHALTDCIAAVPNRLFGAAINSEGEAA